MFIVLLIDNVEVYLFGCDLVVYFCFLIFLEVNYVYVYVLL